MKINSGIKKFLSVLGTVLTVIIFILTIFVLINAVVAKVKNRPASFFGYSFAIVVTQSMEPEIMTGDMIIFKSCSYDDVTVGDDIVFIAGESFGQICGQSVVHKVVDIDDSGIQTQGVNSVTNPSPDTDRVTAENLLGICIYNSTFLGRLFTFFSKFGVVILIALIAIPIIVKQIIKIVKLAKEGNGNGDSSGGNTAE
jgi:signal peptidase I